MRVLPEIGESPLPRVNSLEQLPADYRGYALVLPGKHDAALQSNRGDEISFSNQRRSANEGMSLFHFPKAPPHG